MGCSERSNEQNEKRTRKRERRLVRKNKDPVGRSGQTFLKESRKQSPMGGKEETRQDPVREIISVTCLLASYVKGENRQPTRAQGPK